MKVLNNNREVNLMIWEVNPHKRNVNNLIKFVSNLSDIKEGDIIKGSNESYYTLTSITEKRPSSLRGKTYYSAESKWSYAN